MNEFIKNQFDIINNIKNSFLENDLEIVVEHIL